MRTCTHTITKLTCTAAPSLPQHTLGPSGLIGKRINGSVASARNSRAGVSLVHVHDDLNRSAMT